MKQLIVTIVLFLAYAIFAGLSAWWTGSSWSVNTGISWVWVACIVAFVVSVLASYCLTKVIDQFRNTNGSWTWILIYAVGFLFLWSLSFMTNVHYNYVVKHGYDNMNVQLHDGLTYLNDSIKRLSKDPENRKNIAIENLLTSMQGYQNLFDKSLNDGRSGLIPDGFGRDCITILNQMESFLRSDTALYQDKNNYEIFDDNDASHKSDIGKKDYDRIGKKYNRFITTARETKIGVITRYYDNQKTTGRTLDSLVAVTNSDIKELEKLSKKKNFNDYYTFYNEKLSPLIGAMPEQYKTNLGTKIIDNTGKKRYRIYPSDRMFDWWDVWNDLNILPKDAQLGGKMPMSLALDICAFILFIFFYREFKRLFP